jgi:F-type H+-transporting ATPase subunit a
MFSPLEQFENHFLAGLTLVGSGARWFSLTTISVVTFVNTTVLFGVLWLGFSRPSVLKPVGPQFMVELWWTGLTGVIRQQLGREQRFTPLYVWLFGWVAVNNLTGLVPFNFTVTSHLCVTLFLALSLNVGFLVWGLARHGFRFFGLFVPAGAPVFLLPLIVLIEVVSYLIRPVSLALRLFANMMAGHTLVHILLGFAAGASAVGVVAVSAGIFAVTLLECGIALLQAYVFVVLACIYTRDALEPGH